MSITLHASPLQGYTDSIFRSALNKFFGGVDIFYAPYIRIDGKHEIKKAQQRDLLPKNNEGINLVPQVMCKTAQDFLFVSGFVKDLGYSEINWNLGCPYPMVAKRGLGSGLINNPEQVDRVLDELFSNADISISIKLRLGYENKKEILNLLPILNKYPLKNLAIHPRLGKQLYKGEVDLEGFKECMEITDHKLIYNGDINSIERFLEMRELLPGINNWMIGRWLIADPFLPYLIKNNCEYPPDKKEVFKKFHDTLFEGYSGLLSGPSHIIMKMYQFWQYFILSFPESGKGLKKIKKSKSIEAYTNAVREILI